jgi:enolase-phosphatase E1
VLAQRLLFANTEHGDLSEFISDYFDTRVGAKTDPPSYSTIANKMRLPPAGIVFISDVPAELDAARAAGLQTLLCVRPGNAPTQGHTTHARIRTFDEVRFPEP